MHIFTTTDFQLCAWCLCDKKGELLSIDRTQRRAQFILEMNIEEDEINRRYWGNEKVGAIDFVNALTTVKKRLFSDIPY